MNIKKIKQIMFSLVEDCRDPKTGELNHTLLAEQTADQLNLYIGDDYEIPEEVFDIASTYD